MLHSGFLKSSGMILLLFCLCVLGRSYVLAQAKAVPENPLKTPCSYSHELLNMGGELAVPEKWMADNGTGDSVGKGRETETGKDESGEVKTETGEGERTEAKAQTGEEERNEAKAEIGEGESNKAKAGTGEGEKSSVKEGEEITVCEEETSEEAVKKEKASSGQPETDEPFAQKELSIETDLTDQTVSTQMITFHASYTGITSSAKFSVTCNGNGLSGENGTYQAPLLTGESANLIRLRLTDRVKGVEKSLTREFTIRYVPVTTEENAPRITYTNLSEGMAVSVPEFTLLLSAEDYKGRKIGSEGVALQVNGTSYGMIGDGQHLEYDVLLQEGKNDIRIHLTDTEGHFTDFVWNLVYEEAKEVTVTFSIEATTLGLGELVSSQQVKVDAGKNAAYALESFLLQNGVEFDYGGSFDEGFYLARIRKSGIGSGAHVPEELEELVSSEYNWNGEGSEDSIGEYDYCDKSGWMYSVNGNTPNRSFSKCVLQEGDSVRIRFTLANGKDIGAGANGENYDREW